MNKISIKEGKAEGLFARDVPTGKIFILRGMDYFYMKLDDGGVVRLQDGVYWNIIAVDSWTNTKADLIVTDTVITIKVESDPPKNETEDE